MLYATHTQIDRHAANRHQKLAHGTKLGKETPDGFDPPGSHSFPPCDFPAQTLTAIGEWLCQDQQSPGSFFSFPLATKGGSCRGKDTPRHNPISEHEMPVQLDKW